MRFGLSSFLHNTLMHRIDQPLDTRKLRRLGVVTIGRQIEAGTSIARFLLYR